jgi:hypothetical protein
MPVYVICALASAVSHPRRDGNAGQRGGTRHA